MIDTMHRMIKKYLALDDVKCAIGYEKGSYGFRVSPSFAYTPEDVDRFTFSALCVNNLAVYPMLEEKLPLPRGQIAPKLNTIVVVKGCDSKALVQIIKEKGRTRDEFVIIGIPCKGVVDLAKLEARFPEASGDVVITDNGFVITIDGVEHMVPRAELIAAKCERCEHPNPVIYDELLGDPVEPGEDTFDDVAELEAMSIEDRWKYWEKEFDRCIRCFACRNVCPLCYCKSCSGEELNPEWIRRSVNISENTAWNLLRAYHLAGRCIGCGECERACPMDLPLSQLNRKMAKDVREMFDYTAGTNPDDKPVLTFYNPNDPEGFMK